jgi:hypothetical protein
VIRRNAGKRQLGPSDIPDPGLDRIEASRREAATTGNVGGIAIRSDAKAHQIEEVLSDHMIGGRVEPWSHLMSGLDLTRKELGKLAVRIKRARDSIVTMPANLGQQFLLNTDAPTSAFRQLRDLRWLVGAHQRHLTHRKLDRPSALARKQT